MGSGKSPPANQIRFPPGMSAQQIEDIKRELAQKAQQAGLTVPQFLEQLKQHQMQQKQAQQGNAGKVNQSPQGEPQPILPGPPNPAALAVAKFLRNQSLKPRTSILNGERKDMFRVKRALRALQSPAYEKARTKEPLLPVITDRASLENTFKLLPMSMLALRVVKADGHEGHGHGPGHDHGHDHGKKMKRVKGLWQVRVEPKQEALDEMYYVWFWEDGRVKVKRQLYAALALVIIFCIVLYPLWPLKLRQGVYYLTWGLIILLGLFFLMAIFRVILFCATYFITPPGLWLYPNLWAEVSFMDSFRPLWAWHETTKKKKKRSKSIGSASLQSPFNPTAGLPSPVTATTTATDAQMKVATPNNRKYSAPRVEEADQED